MSNSRAASPVDLSCVAVIAVMTSGDSSERTSTFSWEVRAACNARLIAASDRGIAK